MKRLVMCILASTILILCGGCNNPAVDKTLVVPNTMGALVNKDNKLQMHVKLELILSDDIKCDEGEDHKVEVEYKIGDEYYKILADYGEIEEYSGYRILTIRYIVEDVRVENSSSVSVYLDDNQIVKDTKLIKSSIKENFEVPNYEEISGNNGESYETIRVDKDKKGISYDDVDDDIKTYNLNHFNSIVGSDEKGKIVEYYYNDEVFKVDKSLNCYVKEGFSDYSIEFYLVLEKDGNKYLKKVENKINSRPWERFMDDYVEYLKKVNESK